MPVSSTPAASGTVTPTLGVDSTLATLTTAGTYVLVVDVSNLANGETLTLTITTKALSGGSAAVAYRQTFVHAQGSPLKVSPPVPSAFSIAFVLNQANAGTARAFDWRVDKID